MQSVENHDGVAETKFGEDTKGQVCIMYYVQKQTCTVTLGNFYLFIIYQSRTLDRAASGVITDMRIDANTLN